MFNNIGGKIKSITKTVCIVNIIACIIIGIVLMTQVGFLLGLAVSFFGASLLWESCLTMYGFGQLIENTDRLAKAASAEENKQIMKEQLKKWLERDLITQEEYEQKVEAL